MQKNNLGQNIAVFVLRYRLLILACSLAVVIAAASGTRFLGMSTNYRVFFSDGNPQLTAFEELENRFVKNDNVLIAVAPNNGDVFTRETLAAVKELTWASWKLPYSSRVDSITNFQYTRADDDELIVADLVSRPETLSDTDLQEIKAITSAEPLLLNRLISPTGEVTGVNITFQQPGKAITEVPEIVTAVRKLADDFRHNYPDITLYISGMTMLNNAFSEGALGDMATLMPLMFLIMTLIIWFSIRSLSGTLSTVIIIVASMATAMGIAGWSGILLTPPSASAPTIVMTLAIADSIHILATMLHEMGKGRNKKDAIIESIRINLQPVFLTSISTAIGFLTMNFSDAPPFHDLGNMVAAGVTAAFIYTILVLPALMSLLPVRVKPIPADKKSFMYRFGGFVVKNRRRILWGMTMFILLLSTGIQRIELYDIFSDYFDERYVFRTDTDFIRANLTGIDIIEYSLEAGEESGISNPEYLAVLDEFTRWFRDQPETKHVNSFSDTIKRLNKNMHGDDPSYYRVPEGKELAAQYLLLYEMSLPFGMDINNQINVNKSATRFTVTLERTSSVRIKEIVKRGENWLKAHAPAYMFSRGAGTSVMFAHITYRNIVSMLRGTAVGLVLISGIIIITLRSFKIGLISLVPNLIPAFMAFGFWGLVEGQVGVGLSVVSAMTFGIVVDDTIHFLSKYLRARRENGMSSVEAVQYSFHSVGKALLSTSFILVVGFSVLAFSGFKMNSDMGLMTAITITFALLADFLFLPPLLMVIERERERDAYGAIKQKKGKMMNRLTTIFIITLCCLPALASAQKAEKKGLTIAMEADKRDAGFGDFTANLKMILKNRHGDRSVRLIRSKTLEVKNDGDKSVIIFDNPRDVKGTSMLTFTHKVGNDDQWLYLPALKRVKRISSSNKSGSFMGSEFAYEDVASQEVEKYTYKWLRDEPCPGEEFKGLTCYVSERFPVDKNSGYTRQVEWKDQKEYRQIKVDYYDRKKSLLKTLTYRGYNQHINQYWRAKEMYMLNHQTGKNTLLIWSNYIFRTGLKKKDFTKVGLKRAR